MTVSPVAVVTGGGAGIGREVCLALSEAGFSVLCADIDGDRAEAVADEIRRSGRAASAIAGDVSREAIWPSIVEAASALGRLEVLVSNAAIFPRIAFENTRAEDFDRVMAVNLRAAFLGAAACAPLMRKSGGGAFVFVTSGGGQMSAVANPMQLGFSLYGASKAALDRWAMGIAPELAPLGIAVNLICPGAAVLTEGFNRLSLGAEAPANSISARRMAEAIAFLAQRRPQDGPPARYVATEFGSIWGQR